MNYYYIIIIIIVLTIIYFKQDEMNIWLMNRIIILRGILAPSCFWYKVSDFILGDGSGIDFYNKYKEKYGDFAPAEMFGEKIYLVTNNKFIKIILDKSPNTFTVGKLKMKFFRSFMEKNVGVSTGCPWKKRRHMNEQALNTDILHKYSGKHLQYTKNELLKWNKNKISFIDFVEFGKKMGSKVIFNAETVHPDVLNIFRDANTLVAFEKKYEINKEIHDNYLETLNYYIENPNDDSLVKLLTEVSNDKEELIHQIPHFIFPIVGLYVTTIPRTLALLFNHKNILDKFVKEINQVNIENSNSIYNLSFLRKCILETLRLNNPVVTTFRTLLKDFNFNDKYKFKKGDQFLILNNPVLREKEFFNKPNQFIPSRWTKEKEKSYYSISFSQGPQRCPGKELAIFLAQAFIYNFIKLRKITCKTNIKTMSFDKNYIPQIINPCDISISVEV